MKKETKIKIYVMTFRILVLAMIGKFVEYLYLRAFFDREIESSFRHSYEFMSTSGREEFLYYMYFVSIGLFVLFVGIYCVVEPWITRNIKSYLEYCETEESEGENV